MLIKRIDAGFYTITVEGQTFEAETTKRATEGDRTWGWQLRVAEEDTVYGGVNWVWCDEFETLAECKTAAQKEATHA